MHHTPQRSNTSTLHSQNTNLACVNILTHKMGLHASFSTKEQRQADTHKQTNNKKREEKKRKQESRVGKERKSERKQSQGEKTITYVGKHDRRETSYFPISWEQLLNEKMVSQLPAAGPVFAWGLYAVASPGLPVQQSLLPSPTAQCWPGLTGTHIRTPSHKWSQTLTSYLSHPQLTLSCVSIISHLVPEGTCIHKPGEPKGMKCTSHFWSHFKWTTYGKCTHLVYTISCFFLLIKFTHLVDKNLLFLISNAHIVSVLSETDFIMCIYHIRSCSGRNLHTQARGTKRYEMHKPLLKSF